MYFAKINGMKALIYFSSNNNLVAYPSICKTVMFWKQFVLFDRVKSVAVDFSWSQLGANFKLCRMDYVDGSHHNSIIAFPYTVLHIHA